MAVSQQPLERLVLSFEADLPKRCQEDEAGTKLEGGQDVQDRDQEPDASTDPQLQDG